MAYLRSSEDHRGLILRLEVKQLTASCARQVLQEVEASLDPARVLVLDMSEIDFMDSTAIGELVLLARRLKSRAVTFGIAGFRPPLMDLVRMMRLEQVMALSPDIDTALSRLSVAATRAD